MSPFPIGGFKFMLVSYNQDQDKYGLNRQENILSKISVSANLNREYTNVNMLAIQL